MEIKKSERADLEKIRPQAFLLGLLLGLCGLFVAFEFTMEPDDPLEDPELLDLMAYDEELAPLHRMENELELKPVVKVEPTVKLKIVENDDTPLEEEEIEQPLSEELFEGDVADDDLPEQEEQKEEKDDEVLNFRVVEELPQFPGGYLEFVKWLTRNLKYPPLARQQKVQGRVVAEFIVNKDGSVTDVQVVNSLNRYCDHEALRVLRSMPRWTAGIDNGKPCRTKVCIPIVFKL